MWEGETAPLPGFTPCARTPAAGRSTRSGGFAWTRVGTPFDLTARLAMSGESGSMPPRARPAPDRPPVDSCTTMPGQCRSIPFLRRAERSGSEVAFPSSCRKWQSSMVAPGPKASRVLSACPAKVIGAAGMVALMARLPVIATPMVQAGASAG